MKFDRIRTAISTVFCLLALAACAPAATAPTGAQVVRMAGGDAYLFDATVSALLPEIRMNWNAKRIESEGLRKAREADLKDAPFTCAFTETFGWFKSTGTDQTGIVRPDFMAQLKRQGYEVTEPPVRRVEDASFQHAVVSKGNNLVLLTWIWTPSENPVSVSVDVCKIRLKPGSQPEMAWRLPARSSVF